jgi:hypothetical protein
MLLAAMTQLSTRPSWIRRCDLFELRCEGHRALERLGPSVRTLVVTKVDLSTDVSRAITYHRWFSTGLHDIFS